MLKVMGGLWMESEEERIPLEKNFGNGSCRSCLLFMSALVFPSEIRPLLCKLHHPPHRSLVRLASAPFTSLPPPPPPPLFGPISIRKYSREMSPPFRVCLGSVVLLRGPSIHRVISSSSGRTWAIASTTMPPYCVCTL